MTTTQDIFTLPIYQSCATGKAREHGTFRAMTFAEVVELNGKLEPCTCNNGIRTFTIGNVEHAQRYNERHNTNVVEGSTIVQDCWQCSGTLTRMSTPTSHVWFLSNYNDARQAKVNGKVRTWKRDTTRIEVPLKYGLYEYFTMDKHDIEAGRLLVRVD